MDWWVYAAAFGIAVPVLLFLFRPSQMMERAVVYFSTGEVAYAVRVAVIAESVALYRTRQTAVLAYITQPPPPLRGAPRILIAHRVQPGVALAKELSAYDAHWYTTLSVFCKDVPDESGCINKLLDELRAKAKVRADVGLLAQDIWIAHEVDLKTFARFYKMRMDYELAILTDVMQLALTVAENARALQSLARAIQRTGGLKFIWILLAIVLLYFLLNSGMLQQLQHLFAPR
jgi:hypothetical protein